jgi:hypothetical protein
VAPQVLKIGDSCGIRCLDVLGPHHLSHLLAAHRASATQFASPQADPHNPSHSAAPNGLSSHARGDSTPPQQADPGTRGASPLLPGSPPMDALSGAQPSIREVAEPLARGRTSFASSELDGELASRLSSVDGGSSHSSVSLAEGLTVPSLLLEPQHAPHAAAGGAAAAAALAGAVVAAANRGHAILYIGCQVR